jgi:hypothetical protein
VQSFSDGVFVYARKANVIEQNRRQICSIQSQVGGIRTRLGCCSGWSKDLSLSVSGTEVYWILSILKG